MELGTGVGVGWVGERGGGGEWRGWGEGGVAMCKTTLRYLIDL